jgi:hypothetical protein
MLVYDCVILFLGSKKLPFERRIVYICTSTYKKYNNLNENKLQMRVRL